LKGPLRSFLSYPYQITITICGNISYKNERKALNGPFNCLEIFFVKLFKMAVKDEISALLP
jgi:hypothetical protein